MLFLAIYSTIILRFHTTSQPPPSTQATTQTCCRNVKVPVPAITTSKTSSISGGPPQPYGETKEDGHWEHTFH
ncbi:hypothetical protein EDB19DRAFT_1753165 [Suillus lakei]|nr:hypothetical protein EDB19DRAFT_1753165 [Suillus lakei]